LSAYCCYADCYYATPYVFADAFVISHFFAADIFFIIFAIFRVSIFFTLLSPCYATFSPMLLLRHAATLLLSFVAMLVTYVAGERLRKRRHIRRTPPAPFLYLLRHALPLIAIVTPFR